LIIERKVSSENLKSFSRHWTQLEVYENRSQKTGRERVDWIRLAQGRIYVRFLRQSLIKPFRLSARLHLRNNPRMTTNFIKFDVGEVYLNLLMN
jgi:hypothetical protein